MWDDQENPTLVGLGATLSVPRSGPRGLTREVGAEPESPSLTLASPCHPLGFLALTLASLTLSSLSLTLFLRSRTPKARLKPPLHNECIGYRNSCI